MDVSCCSTDPVADILRFILKGSTSSGVSSHYAELKKAITTADFFTPLGDNKAITVPHAYQPSACRDVANLVVEEVLDEGTYGCVSVAKDPVSGKNFALKLLKNTNGRYDSWHNTWSVCATARKGLRYLFPDRGVCIIMSAMISPQRPPKRSIGPHP